ncbi:hypothetical protein QFC24_004569 [Naganishia onofrii]|uniref:Uncharacterized protein n=1 Tax=Naganishia onofrii TaxID=1851511 RepID=A0ACC2XEB0_9TREE|nr:hypothetical protein QFC24_004569 [Naganishia onofrii]
MTSLHHHHFHQHEHEHRHEQEQERKRQECEPSSPLSSLPSSYHSLPEVTSMPERPRGTSAPLPPPSSSPLPLPLPNFEVFSSNLKETTIIPSPLRLPLDQSAHHAVALQGKDREFGIILPSEGQDSAIGNVANALGLYVDHHHAPPSERIYRAKKRVEEPIKAPRKGETTFILRKPAPRPRLSDTRNSQQQHQHQHAGIFDSFSSLEFVTGGWPPSPSVTRSWKLVSTTTNNAVNAFYEAGGGGVGKRKRNTSDDREGVENILDGAAAKKARKGEVKWISKPSRLSLEHQQDTSPDYRGMLNLSSDTPAPSDTDTRNLANNIDPFTQSRGIAPLPTFQMFNVSAGVGDDVRGDGDESLSPTIRNPSIGSMDSEDLSIACLAPAIADAVREISFGRFGCSGNWEENNVPAAATAAVSSEAEVKRRKEQEERRLADVIERWMKGHGQASTTTTASSHVANRHVDGQAVATVATGPAMYQTAGGRGYLISNLGKFQMGCLMLFVKMKRWCMPVLLRSPESVMCLMRRITRAIMVVKLRGPSAETLESI